MPEEEQKPEENNVRVMVRCRLFNKREIVISKKNKEALRPCVKMRGKTCAIVEFIVDEKGFTHEKERDAFDFDECFWSMPIQQYVTENEIATQKDVYEKSGLHALNAAFDGFNVCIFAYGQTGSGKTYSMLGTDNDPGISPQLVDDMFQRMAEISVRNPTTKCQLECTFYEIYNEKVRDLFNKKSNQGHYDNAKIRQHPTKGVYVEGLTAKEVATAVETKSLIEKGTNERAMAETKMNAHSSRSHAVFQLRLTQNDAMKGTQRVAIINLVDLAGSEKVKLSEVQGQAFVEAKNINQSLSTLRRVIDTLIENSQSKHQKVPPFRESVLTYVLSDSLGGNSKTQMIATISPHDANMEDTIGTLRYALRAKAIVCKVQVNEEKSAAMMDAMREEIMELQRKLRTGGTSGADGGGGGGGGGQMMPEEIEKEIAIREAEVKKMEETSAKMEIMLDESRHKEEEMRKKIVVIDEQKAELSIAVGMQKRERFAAAFRNAFLLHGDRKRIEETESKLEAAMDARMRFEQEAIEATDAKEQAVTQAQDLEIKLETLDQNYQNLKDETDERTARNERTIYNLTGQTESLQKSMAEMSKRLQRVTTDKNDVNERNERLQMEMLSVAQGMEREELEKNRLKKMFEDAELKHADVIEQLRRRKEKYKQENITSSNKHAELVGAVKIHSLDRAQLLETVKAQQNLLAEKEFLIGVAQKTAKESHERTCTLRDRCDQLETDVKGLREALAEYHSASNDWMHEHAHMERELALLRSAQHDSRYKTNSVVSRSRSPAATSSQLQQQQPQYHVDPVAAANGIGPLRKGRSGSPARRPSPTAVQAMSPYFRQPKVETFSVSGSGLVRRTNSPIRAGTRL